VKRLGHCGEERDVLLDSVLEDGELLLPHVRDVDAAPCAHDDGHCHEIRLDSQRLGLLPISRLLLWLSASIASRADRFRRILFAFASLPGAPGLSERAYA
jgi:hypothetical protein